METLELKRLGRQVPTRGVYDEAVPSLLDQPLASKVLHEWWGFSFLPFQQLILKNALAVKNGRLFYRNVGISIPRQNGKTLSAEARMALSLTMLREDAVYTSWREDSSLAIYTRFLDRIEEAKDRRTPLAAYFPVLPSRKAKIPLIKSIDPITGRHLGQVRFATRKGGTGRGKSESLIIIDEAQDLTVGEHDSLTAGAATFKNGQVWYIGTPEPAESSSSKGFTGFNAQGLTSLFGQVRKEALSEKAFTAWFEWGVERLPRKEDVDSWYEANPALGYEMGEGRGIDESFLASRMLSDESFAIEHLGFWSTQERNSAIEVTRWNGLALSKEEAATFKAGTVAVAVKSDIDEKAVDVAVAVRKPSGEIFIELQESFDLQKPWLDALWRLLEPYTRAPKCKSIIIDGQAARSQVRARLEAEGKWRSTGHRFKQGKISFAASSDVAQASTLLIGMVNEGSVFHGAQASLDAAVSDAGKRQFRSGSGFGFTSISGKTESNHVEAVALALLEASKNRTADDITITTDGATVTGFDNVTSF